MSSRTISFLQVVQESDPSYQIGKNRPWIYELSNGRLFYTIPNPYTQFTSDLTNSSGTVHVSDATWPTSATGLKAGQVWSNSNVATIVGPASPQPGVPNLYFSAVNSTELLNLNLANMRTNVGPSGSGILWNNAGVLSVS